MFKYCRQLAAVAAVGAAIAASTVQAAPIVTFGQNSAVSTVSNNMSFDANTTVQNNWIEGGLLASYVDGSGDNNGCGFEGYWCYDFPSDLGAGFSGNFMATAGTNAYISIKQAQGTAFRALEFTVGSLSVNPYASTPANVFGYWRTYSQGALTGAGNFSRASGTVIGLADATGFDELRYYAFSANNLTTGFSAPIVDEIRAQQVPEPGSFALLGLGLGACSLARRFRRRSSTMTRSRWQLEA